jgi:hypothetical protein
MVIDAGQQKALENVYRGTLALGEASILYAQLQGMRHLIPSGYVEAMAKVKELLASLIEDVCESGHAFVIYLPNVGYLSDMRYANNLAMVCVAFVAPDVWRQKVAITQSRQGPAIIGPTDFPFEASADAVKVLADAGLPDYHGRIDTAAVFLNRIVTDLRARLPITLPPPPSVSKSSFPLGSVLLAAGVLAVAYKLTTR